MPYYHVNHTQSDIKKSQARKRKCLTRTKKTPKFVLHTNRLDNHSLFDAMKNLKITFDDNLAYRIPQIKNVSFENIEDKIQRLNRENTTIFYRFKEQSSKGFYLPVQIKFDDVQVQVLSVLSFCF